MRQSLILFSLFLAVAVAAHPRAMGGSRRRQDSLSSQIVSQYAPRGFVGSSSRLRDSLNPQYCAYLACPPKDVHSAFVSGPDLSISWVTLHKTRTSTCTCSFDDPSTPDRTYTGSQHTYLHSDQGNEYLWMHDVVLSELNYSSSVSCRCGDTYGGMSSVYRYSTPPDPADETSKDTSVFVLADQGLANSQGPTSYATQWALEDKYDFVVHAGDISYADDYSAGQYEVVWSEWFDMMSQVQARKIYMVAPGNHEYSCEHTGCILQTKNFTAYRNRFRMPFKESGGINNMWYSFDYQNVHFVAIDTETDYKGAPEGSHLFGDQVEWLKRDLEKNAENRMTDWLIVFGHRPMYSSSKGYSESDGSVIVPPLDLIDAMEDLFLQYNVDMYICGHVHTYERSFPVAKQKRQKASTSVEKQIIDGTVFNVTRFDSPTSPIHIVVGNAGNTEGLSNKAESSWAFPEGKYWNAYRFGTDFGFGMLKFPSVTPNDHPLLEWRMYSATDGVLRDVIQISKSS